MFIKAIEIEIYELNNAVKASNAGGFTGKKDLIVFWLEKADRLVSELFKAYLQIREEKDKLANELQVYKLREARDRLKKD